MSSSFKLNFLLAAAATPIALTATAAVFPPVLIAIGVIVGIAVFAGIIAACCRCRVSTNTSSVYTPTLYSSGRTLFRPAPIRPAPIRPAPIRPAPIIGYGSGFGSSRLHHGHNFHGGGSRLHHGHSFHGGGSRRYHGHGGGSVSTGAGMGRRHHGHR